MNDSEILLIDKPSSMSSFGVVARVRRVLSQAAGHRVKVGHTGTLDPFATGLLILLVGKGTKRSSEFLKLDKWYEATIRLGQVSSTGDIEGEISDYISGHCAGYDRALAAEPRDDGREERGPEIKSLIEPAISQVEEVVSGFIGEVEQKVPAFSAVKINGQRAYKLAREGKKVDTPVRKVNIYSIEILDYKWPELSIRCHVSSGTYIRTLGEDIGSRLGVGGYLTALRRTQVGKYKVSDAVRLDEFMKGLEKI